MASDLERHYYRGSVPKVRFVAVIQHHSNFRLAGSRCQPQALIPILKQEIISNRGPSLALYFIEQNADIDICLVVWPIWYFYSLLDQSTVLCLDIKTKETPILISRPAEKEKKHPEISAAVTAAPIVLHSARFIR